MNNNQKEIKQTEKDKGSIDDLIVRSAIAAANQIKDEYAADGCPLTDDQFDELRDDVTNTTVRFFATVEDEKDYVPHIVHQYFKGKSVSSSKNSSISKFNRLTQDLKDSNTLINQYIEEIGLLADIQRVVGDSVKIEHLICSYTSEGESTQELTLNFTLVDSLKSTDPYGYWFVEELHGLADKYRGNFDMVFHMDTMVDIVEHEETE